MRSLLVSLLALLIAGPASSEKVVRASFYHDKFHGRLTANGEVFTQWELTAAHRTLPFCTTVRVTNTKTKQSVVVRVNDRGPFTDKFSIDLSKYAAHSIGVTAKNGWAWVKLEVLDTPKKPCFAYSRKGVYEPRRSVSRAKGRAGQAERGNQRAGRTE